MQQFSEKNITLGAPWAVSLLVILLGATVSIVQYLGTLKAELQVVQVQMQAIDARTAKASELELQLARFDERLRAMSTSSFNDQRTQAILTDILKRVQGLPGTATRPEREPN